MLLAIKLLLTASAVLAQTYIDDRDPDISYISGDWGADVNQSASAYLYDNTQSYSNSTNAAYGFAFYGASFALCSRRDNTAGSYIVSVDNQLQGTGSGNSLDPPSSEPCVYTFTSGALSLGNHTVLVQNADTRLLFLDLVAYSTNPDYFYNLSPIAQTLASQSAAIAQSSSPASSTVASSTMSSSSISSSAGSTSIATSLASSVTSVLSTSSSISRSSAPSQISSSTAQSRSSSIRPSSSTSSGVAASGNVASGTVGDSSSLSGGAIAGIVVGVVLGLAAIAAILFLWRKRRQNIAAKRANISRQMAAATSNFPIVQPSPYNDQNPFNNSHAVEELDDVEEQRPPQRTERIMSVSRKPVPNLLD